LADDMGLGKTVQISTYLTSLRSAKLINKAIIIVPATLIAYWESEIHRWLPEGQELVVAMIYGSAK
jgi:SNF2 family DNA or RNA helicase